MHFISYEAILQDLNMLYNNELKSYIKNILQGKELLGIRMRETTEEEFISDLYNYASSFMRKRLKKCIEELIIDWQMADDCSPSHSYLYYLSLVMTKIALSPEGSFDKMVFNKFMRLIEGETLKGISRFQFDLVDLHWDILGMLKIDIFRQYCANNNCLKRICLRDLDDERYFFRCYNLLFLIDLDYAVSLFPKFVRFGMKGDKLIALKNYFFIYRDLYKEYKKIINDRLEIEILPSLTADEMKFFLQIWKEIINNEGKSVEKKFGNKKSPV